jgi:polyferredoxin
MDVIRDRASIAREIDDGRIENVYRLQIMNTLEVPRRFRLDLESENLEHAELLVDPRDLEIAPTQTKEVTVRVRADATSHHGSRKIEFELETTDKERPARLKEHSRFLIP